MECIFCKIAKHEVPAMVVWESEAVQAFADAHPKAPVHILVIPKEHIRSIAHLEANHGAVITELIYAAKRIAAEKHLTGYKLVFNVGREGGQVVDHLHLHLLGGWADAESGKQSAEFFL